VPRSVPFNIAPTVLDPLRCLQRTLMVMVTYILPAQQRQARKRMCVVSRSYGNNPSITFGFANKCIEWKGGLYPAGMRRRRKARRESCNLELSFVALEAEGIHGKHSHRAKSRTVQFTSTMYVCVSHCRLEQCFSTARPWHQLYRAARGSPGICHFSFLSNFHE